MSLKVGQRLQQCKHISAIVLSMFMLSFMFVMVHSLFEVNLCRFLWFVYIATGDPVIKRDMIPLTDLNLPNFCDYPKPGSVFPTS